MAIAGSKVTSKGRSGVPLDLRGKLGIASNSKRIFSEPYSADGPENARRA